MTDRSREPVARITDVIPPGYWDAENPLLAVRASHRRVGEL